MAKFSNQTKAGAGLCALMLGAIALVNPLTVASEGKSNAAYLDPVGIPTICYGDTAGVQLGDIKTDEECEELLLEKQLETALFIAEKTDVFAISEQEFGAYIDLVYNIGGGNFARSTLLEKLNVGDRRGACEQLPRWSCAAVPPDTKGIIESCGNGRYRLRGLLKRRKAEEALCLSGL